MGHEPVARIVKDYKDDHQAECDDAYHDDEDHARLPAVDDSISSGRRTKMKKTVMATMKC